VQIRAKSFAGKTGQSQFWAEYSRFFQQNRLLFERVDISVTEVLTTTSEKEEKKSWV